MTTFRRLKLTGHNKDMEEKVEDSEAKGQLAEEEEEASGTKDTRKVNIKTIQNTE